MFKMLKTLITYNLTAQKLFENNLNLKGIKAIHTGKYL